MRLSGKAKWWQVEGLHLLKELRRIGIIYLLFSLTRLLFFLFNRHFFTGIAPLHLGQLMVAGLLFDTTAIVYTNMLYLALAFLPFYFRYTAWYQAALKWIFIVTNSVALCANCVDFIYFRFTLRRTSSLVFEEFRHEGNLWGLFGQFLIDYWYVFLIGAALIWTISATYGRPILYTPERNVRRHLLFFLRGSAMLLVVAFLVVGGARGGWAHSTRPITISNASAYVKEPLEVAIVLNTPFAIYKTIDNQSLPAISYFETEEELERIYSPIFTPDSAAEQRRWNVMIIILESFGSERISAYNPGRKAEGYSGYTPFLDSIIPHSLAFQYSLANGWKSIDAMPSVLASIPMMVEPFVISEFSNNRISGLATELGKAGYHAAFFHGAPKGSMGFDAFARMAGFQEYYGREAYGPDDYDGIWGVWDEPFLQFVANMLTTLPQPFLASVFTVSSHHPFRVPPQYKDSFPTGPHPIQEVIGYTDHALRRFFATARQQPWYDSTLFVITGDHTNASIFPEYKTTVGRFRVPIIFFMPGKSWGGLQPRIAQQIDIMPTILGLLGYQEPFIAFGRDLLAGDNEWAVSYIGASHQLLQDEWVLLYNGEPTALYNYRYDSLFRYNLLGVEPEITEEMVRKVQAFTQQYNNRMRENRLTVSPEE